MTSAPISPRRNAESPQSGTRALAGAVGLALLAAATGCSASEGESITIGVASSLADVAPILADAFEHENPGQTVDITVAGSATLVSQSVAGAPYDAIVVADEHSLIQLQADGLIVDSLAIASNSVVLASAEQPAPGAGVSDQWLIAACTAHQPCGRGADALTHTAYYPLEFDILLSDARAVTYAITSGEADAGIVYATNAKAAQLWVIFAPALDPFVVVGATLRDDPGAAMFLDFLASQSAAEILEQAGFAAPDGAGF